MNTRRICLVLGIAVLASVWLGPLPELAPRAFWAHMTMHMGVVAVAAPLLACAVAGGRIDPVRRAARWFPAIPLSLVELAAVWAWHAPALHAAARTTTTGLLAEQGTFLLTGWLVWLSALGGGWALRTERAPGGIAALLLTSMHMTLLGALLALTPRPLYATGIVRELCGSGSAADVQLGGAIMLLVGGIAYLAGGLGLTATILLPRRTHMEVTR